MSVEKADVAIKECSAAETKHTCKCGPSCKCGDDCKCSGCATGCNCAPGKIILYFLCRLQFIESQFIIMHSNKSWLFHVQSLNDHAFGYRLEDTIKTISQVYSVEAGNCICNFDDNMYPLKIRCIQGVFV